MKKSFDGRFVAFWFAIIAGVLAGAVFMVKAIDLVEALRVAGSIASSVGVEGISWAIGPAMGLLPYGLLFVGAAVSALILGHGIERDEIVEARVISAS